ncbi:zinc finger C3H1 domain-containing protein-like [Lingula anatina]|uniref:Zinc finger C3H1 domain-containing protein-like n=1 Tax=Lingula anatina TaxID=7574 RepID=A0A1S3HDK1_LINAN|nr:zinc finger C3H1 domain-containing protein-like [Lingula anatina]|eukprot:XP_013383591.1 zinc finger C3H1 domain-containing protein-like [Lingula anatina]
MRSPSSSRSSIEEIKKCYYMINYKEKEGYMEVEEDVSGREEGELSDDGEIKGDSEEEGEAKDDPNQEVNIPGLDLVNRPEDAVDIPGLDLVNKRTPTRSRTRQASSRILEKYRHGKNSKTTPRQQSRRPVSPPSLPSPSSHFWARPPVSRSLSPTFHGPINHHNEPHHQPPSRIPHRPPHYSSPPRYHPWGMERDPMAAAQDWRRNSGSRDTNRPVRERHRSNGRQSKPRPTSGDKPIDKSDGDYNELLLRYKLVQKQLDVLRKEDEQASKLLGGEDTGSKKREIDELDTVTSTAHTENGQPGSEDQTPDPGAKLKSEEEDVDELELRLLALASAAKNLDKKPVLQKKAEDEPQKSQDQKQPRRGRQEALRKPEPYRRQDVHRKQSNRRGPSRRYARQSLERTKRPTRRSSERERQKEWERQRERGEHRFDDQSERPRLIASVLSIDDPEEQYRRFMKMVANDRNTTTSGNSRSQSKSPRHQGVSSDRTGDWSHDPREAENDAPLVLLDNYEEVEMEIDSNEGSPAIFTEDLGPQFGFEDLYLPMEAPLPSGGAGTVYPPPPPPPPEEPPPLPEEDPEEDEEEAELRAMLLQGIINKRKQVDRPEPEQMSEPSSRNESPVPVLHKPKYPPRPKRVMHKPLVINLGGDSSDSEHEDKGATNLLGGLDFFLKQARQSVETPKPAAQQKHSPTTPEAMVGMPEDKKREYKELKEKLIKKEKEKLSQTSKLNQESGISKASNDGAAKQNVKKLEVSQTDAVSVKAVPTLDGVANPEAREASVRSDELEGLEVKYQKCSEKIVIQRQGITKDKQTLKTIQVHLDKRTVALQTAEEKIQKLQEQLAAAEKIAITHRNNIEKLNKQSNLIQTRIKRRSAILNETEKEAADLEAILKKNTITDNIAVNSVKRKANSIDVQTVKKPKTVATEQAIAKETVITTEHSERKMDNRGKQKLTKEQLQRLEQEYRIKIEMLKRTHLENSVKSKEQDKRTKEHRIKFNTRRARTKPIAQPNLENIEKLTVGQEKEKPANDLQPKIRRKSFLDLNISMKPNLELTNLEQGVGSVATSKPVGNDNDNEISSGSAAKISTNTNVQQKVADRTEGQSQFTMPTGSQLENLCRLQKEKVDKFAVDEFSTKNIHYDLTEGFWSRLQEIPGLSFEMEKSTDSVCDIFSSQCNQYCSPLLNFRSYRFSPYFRQKSGHCLTTATFAHKLEPKKALCRFDLKGTCNEECPWQHESDHVMTASEQLIDIISYCPSVAGVADNASAEECERIISSWVDNFKKQHESKMNQEEMCLLLVDKVNEKTGHSPPCTVFTEPRKWKPTAICRTPPSQELKPKETKVLMDLHSSVSPVDTDDIISEQDIRYFMLSSHDIQDMESAVLETPHDTQLWIKLAYKKMRDHRSDSPTDKGLEHALNVLARGLEANKHSSDLWQHYLNLHKKLGQFQETLDMCEQAVKLAPSYELWWMYLTLTKPFSKKETICQQILAYLQAVHHMPQAQISHQILEIMLYQVSLNIQSGRYKSGLKIIQNVLKPEVGGISPLCRCMVPQDRVLTWLAYLNLLETQSLPQCMFDPANNNPGRIVNKEPFIVPWKSKRPKGSKDNPIQNFSLAFKQCSQSKLGTEINIANCMPLYRNLVALEVAKGRYEPAKGVCRKLLSSSPSNTDLWLCLADICKRQKKVEEVRAVLSEAKSKVAGPKASVLYHAAASFELTQVILLLNDSPTDKGLELALNVLARGLEANKHSTDLWQHYLNLHKKLGQFQETLDMCEQAVKLAPSYELWWMYLTLTKPFSKKETICQQILAYLQAVRHMPQAQISHQILEIMLYQVSLNIQSGRYKSGLKIIQNVLKPEVGGISPLCRCMVPQDRVLTWLAYLNLLETQSLPQCMFDPANNNPGRIVNKEPFIVPWKSKRPKGSKDNPIQNFSLAFKQCSQSKLGTEINIANCMPLYRNLVALEVAKGRYEPAKGVCRKLLSSSPSNTDLWLCLADICKRQKKVEEVRAVLSEAKSKVAGPKASVLYHAAVSFELTQGDADSALEELERCVIDLFDVDINNSKICDPNLLYCKVLGQSLPLTYKEPQYKEGVSAEDVRKHMLYMWLNYSTLLHLQGDDAQAVEVYETALYSVKSVEDVRAVWVSYLRHKFQVALTKGKSSEVSVLRDLNRRCLQTTPVSFPLPFCPSKHWNNYTFHNQVVDLYLQSLTKDQIGPAFRHFLKMMPGNVELVVKSVQYFHEDGDDPAILSLCYPALYDLPACTRLWKIAINLLLKQGKVKEVHKAYQKAVGSLQYTVSLWKDFILFAISQQAAEVVTKLIEECNRLEVNIAPFVATILKLS